MISHYLTLKALTNELALFVEHAVIEEVYSQQKNELLLTCRSPQGGRVDHGGGTLCVSVEPHFNYLYFRDVVQRKRKNSADIFPGLIGRTIVKITIQPDDRIISIILENSNVLRLQLFNTAASNIVLENSSGQIVESFKKNKLLHGTIPDVKGGGKRMLPDKLRFIAQLYQQGETNILSALKHIVPGLPMFFLSEALYRMNVSSLGKVSDLDGETGEKLFLTLNTMIEECAVPRPRMYLPEDGAPLFSLVGLQSQRDHEEKLFESVSSGVRTFISQKYRDSQVEDQRGTIHDAVKRELKKQEHTYDTMQSQQLKDPSEYEQIGHVLLSHLHEMKKGMKQIELPEMTDATLTTRVTLDPARTPVQNAEQYFTKAKKARAARDEASERIKKISDRIVVLRQMDEELGTCETTNDVKRYINKYKEGLKVMGVTTGAQIEAPPPFRVFSVAGGFEVWVGKNSANNDLLTMKYAKPGDLWFHVRGAGGSHVVLKRKGGGVQIPKEAIRQAAGIAAYYSKMKNAGTVPVAYCERKYVRKSKGSDPGAVVLEREEVIFVKPQLP
jgi:predicted ribosome quality control (RQC) complex YloA/Tae2 family protein